MKKVLIILTIIIFAACSSDDDGANDNDPFDSFVRADINGETITFNFGPNSIGASITSSTEGSIAIYGFGMGASTDGVSDNSETTSISVGLITTDPDAIVIGAIFNYPADLIGGSYTYENINESISVDGDETISATMTITAVDVAAEKVSGTFSYVTVDGNTDVSYSVSNGVFSNIPYYTN